MLLTNSNFQGSKLQVETYRSKHNTLVQIMFWSGTNNLLCQYFSIYKAVVITENGGQIQLHKTQTGINKTDHF
jgi:hypothetical protein